MKYQVGDIVRLKQKHSEGDLVKIHAIEEVQKYPLLGSRAMYKIYIPYWDYFYVSDDDIIERINVTYSAP